MNGTRFIPGSFLALMLAACGGGGNGGSNNPPPPPPPPAPSGLSYTAPPVLTVGSAITALNPTVTGTPTGYTIAPALPAGLTINATTGAISGTPTAPQAATNHTVTASNAGGSTTATMSVRVNDLVASITYPRTDYRFVTGSAITAVAPAVTGGAVVSWSIDQALPAGLAFSTTTGQISGTPTVIAAAAPYVVTATNSGGTDTFNLSIGVGSGVLLELRHISAITRVGYNGSRVMGVDQSGRVGLYDAQNGSTVVLSGPTCDLTTCGDLANLVGPTFVIRRLTGFDVYAAQTGALLANIASPSSAGSKWSIASDGSYVVTWSSTGLSAWTTAGTSLITRAGNYSTAGVFAAAAEIRIANGPAGAQVVEKLSVPGGTSTTTPAYIGGFHSWFADGDRFLTRANNTVVVYSHAGAQEDTAILPGVNSLGGAGDWFWIRTSTFPAEVNLYAVGTAGTPTTNFPAASGDVLVPSGNTLGLVRAGSIGVVDLSLATPTVTNYILTGSGTAGFPAYAAVSATDAVYGNSYGVLQGPLTAAQPVRYSYGFVRSIAGSSSRIAVATASDDILFFNAATLAPEGTLRLSSTKVLLSVDGSVFATSVHGPFASSPASSLRVYSLPANSVLAQWNFPAGASNPVLADFSLNSAGDIVGQVTEITGSATITRRVVRYDNSVIWTDTIAPGWSDLSFRLSPSGTRVAAANDASPLDTSGTNIYLNTALTGALSGWPAGWIDESRLLVHRYRMQGTISPTAVIDSSVIVSPTGQILASPTLPDVRRFQAVDANTIYSPQSNVMIDLTTGNTVWSTTSSRFMNGAVAGGYVVFDTPQTEATVRAEPR